MSPWTSAAVEQRHQCKHRETAAAAAAGVKAPSLIHIHTFASLFRHYLVSRIHYLFTHQSLISIAT